MFNKVLNATHRFANRTGTLTALTDRLLDQIVPKATAGAAFYWVRKCKDGLGIVSCPPHGGSGDAKRCDVLCETHSGGTTCYWGTAKNCTNYCGSSC